MPQAPRLDPNESFLDCVDTPDPMSLPNSVERNKEVQAIRVLFTLRAHLDGNALPELNSDELRSS